MTKRVITAIAVFLFAFFTLGYAQTNSIGLETSALAGVAQGSLPGVETNALEGSAQSISLGVKVGTLGPGAEAAIALSDFLGIRFGANYLPLEYEGTFDDVDYDVDLTLRSVSALIDVHPFKGAFRISGGVVYNGNELESEATPTSPIEIGDVTYLTPATQVGTLKGEVDFDDIAPYLGLGWDTSFGKEGAFGFIADLGVMYQGSPEVELTANGTLAGNPAFQAELAKEEKNIQDDLDDFKFYPVISVGFSYRF